MIGVFFSLISGINCGESGVGFLLHCFRRLQARDRVLLKPD